MSKDDDKNKSGDLFNKAKMGIAVGGLVISGVTDAYKGKTPSPEKMGADYQRSQDLNRRGSDKKK